MVKVISILLVTALKGKNLLPLGANSFLKKKFTFRKGTQLKRITAVSSSLPFMCVTVFGVQAEPLINFLFQISETLLESVFICGE